MCARAVREVIVERGRAAGVVLEDGTPVRARAVIANVDPQRLFQTLVPREAVPSRDGGADEGRGKPAPVRSA